MSQKTDLEILEIEFADSEFDWIIFALRLGGRTMGAYFTAVFDPLRNFKCWLEEIALGGSSCVFAWDGEGPSFALRFERTEPDSGIFTAEKNGEVKLEGKVSRRQLLTTLYRGFLSYGTSYKFLWANYQRMDVWEVLTMSTGLDYKTLINELAKFDRPRLVELFANAKPKLRLSINFTNQFYKWALWGIHIDTQIGQRPRLQGWQKVGYPIEWRIPANFEGWDRQARLDFAEYSISGPVDDYRDSGRISDLHSRIIEDFLDRSPTEESEADTILDLDELCVDGPSEYPDETEDV